MKQPSYKWSYAALIIGAFSFCGGVTQQPNNRESVMTGLIMAVSSSAFISRKKQKYGGPKTWLLLEIPSLLLFLWLSRAALYNNNWYDHPLTFVIVPVWGIVSYAMILFAKRKQLALPEDIK